MVFAIIPNSVVILGADIHDCMITTRCQTPFGCQAPDHPMSKAFLSAPGVPFGFLSSVGGFLAVRAVQFELQVEDELHHPRSFPEHEGNVPAAPLFADRNLLFRELGFSHAEHGLVVVGEERPQLAFKLEGLGRSPARGLTDFESVVSC